MSNFNFNVLLFLLKLLKLNNNIILSLLEFEFDFLKEKNFLKTNCDYIYEDAKQRKTKSW